MVARGEVRVAAFRGQDPPALAAFRDQHPHAESAARAKHGLYPATTAGRGIASKLREPLEGWDRRGQSEEVIDQAHGTGELPRQLGPVEVQTAIGDFDPIADHRTRDREARLADTRKRQPFERGAHQHRRVRIVGSGQHGHLTVRATIPRARKPGMGSANVRNQAVGGRLGHGAGVCLSVNPCINDAFQ